MSNASTVNSRFSVRWHLTGGFDLGFERAGIKTVWQVEIDPFCRKVLAKNFPGAQRFDDVRHCGDNLPGVDCITGGFPCQDISLAGNGAGLDGKRSGLWREMARIVRVLQPRFVVVENVAALLGRGLGRVIGDLATLGYDTEWDCLPALAFGAHHIRDRLFVVAYPNCRRRRPDSAGGDNANWPDPGRPQADGLSGTLCEAGGKENMANSDTTGLSLARNPETITASTPRIFTRAAAYRTSAWEIEPDVGRVAHGIPARVDRLKGLGNAIVPQIAEWIGKRIIANHEHRETFG